MRIKMIGCSITKKGIFFLLIVFALCIYGGNTIGQGWSELLKQADSLSEAGNYDSAIVIGQRALDITEKEFGREDTTFALILHHMGIYHYDKVKYSEVESFRQWGSTFISKAESLFKSALSIREKVLGSEHLHVAATLEKLEFVLWNGMRKYAEAESLYKRALAIKKKVLSPEHPDVAKNLFGLANLYLDEGKFDKAELLCEQALTMWERMLAPSDPIVIESLNRLAFMYINQRMKQPGLVNLAKPEQVLKRALAICERDSASALQDCAESTHLLGSIYLELGKLGEAEPLLERALDMCENTIDPDRCDIGHILNNLGGTYAWLGKYAAAEATYKRALTIDDIRGICLNNLAALYMTLAKYTEAELYLTSALAREDSFNRHRVYPMNLLTLAELYRRQDRYDEAESLYTRILPNRVTGYASIAERLSGLADVYLDQGRYAEAESVLNRRQYICKRFSVVDSDLDAAAVLNQSANLYSHQGKYTKAEALYEQALNVVEETFGPNHPSVAEVLSNLALLLRDKRRFNDSRRLSKRAFEITCQNFRDASQVLSEKDALNFSNLTRNGADQYFSILLDSKARNWNLSKEVARVLFRIKGQVSDNIFARHQSYVFKKDTTLKALTDSLMYTRFKLANLYVKGPDEEAIKGYKEKLLEVSKQKERLEAELARQSSQVRRELELWEVDPEKVAASLPPNSTLVEYLKFNRLTTEANSEPHYLVIVLNRRRIVYLADLGLASEIDSAVALYRSHILKMSQKMFPPSKKDLEVYRGIAGRIYDLAWKPVEERLGQPRLVFIAPDGALNLVSFASLIDETGSYLIEKYPVHYLSAGRDLLRYKYEVPLGTGLLSVGDPDFDAIPELRAKAVSPRIAEVEMPRISLYPIRNVRSGCDYLYKLKVCPLPATREEIRVVSENWRAYRAEPVKSLVGVDASEDNFKKEVSGKRVIHLATHGYYLTDECLPRSQSVSFLKSDIIVGENPLLLSGLLLAGANLHGEGADRLGVEDGILTAEEIAGMNLRGTQMAVLSACETGLGEVKSGEGVYGLRRAFQMAGTRTVISALWSVSDKATAEMMSKLYISRRKSLPETLREIQLDQINTLRRNKQIDHPINWDGFIVMGDWR